MRKPAFAIPSGMHLGQEQVGVSARIRFLTTSKGILLASRIVVFTSRNFKVSASPVVAPVLPMTE